MTKAPERSVNALLRQGVSKLNACSIDGAARDARLLLANAMGREPGEMIALGPEQVSNENSDRFFMYIDQRMSGKPVHRIIGAREFYGRRFALNEASLEPRPETELLVERIIADFPGNQAIRFCDVGSGSGAIVVSLLSELPNATGVATDISARALEATHANAVSHNVSNRLQLIECDCLDGVDGPFDFIVSNPPYIPSCEIAELARDVREHDPVAALDGGSDGLMIYRKLLIQAAPLLKANGLLYLETGHGQHDAICQLAEELANKLTGKLGWGIRERLLDLSGLERIVVLQS